MAALRLRAFSSVVLGAFGCAQQDLTASEPPASVPCTLATLADEDPAEDVVAVSLVAGATRWDPGTGTDVEGFAFNGTVPGPIIEVEVGQRLRVDFLNDGEEPTTIHWHGLRVPELVDGVAQMMDPVDPGERFTYEFDVLDAGFYWYHPHMDTAQALEAGLYGAIVVRAPGERPASCDVPIVLDDVLLDRDTLQIEPPALVMDQMMGRLGTHLLANGRTDRNYEVVAGDTAVLRFVNAANARHLDIGIAGHPFTVLATDGGWLGQPYTVERLRLSPGERSIVAFTAPEGVGEVLTVTNRRVHLHHEGGDMMEYDPLGDEERTVFWLQTVAGDGTGFEPPSYDSPPLVQGGDAAHTWVLEEDMMGGTVTIDGASFPDVPMVTAEGFVQTTFVIDNRSEMRHPFHLHGNRFQVVDIGGEAVTVPAWKDTVDVPAETRVTIVSELDNPGEWLYHCHILEHGDAGMAGMLRVQ